MSKKLAFTICSLNYLGQAIALKNSLLEHNPDYDFVIGLCDRIDSSTIKPEELEGINIVEVHTIGIENFVQMCDLYDITELNTAIKPFFFDYFFKHEKNYDSILYIDPDILVFDNFDVLHKNFENNDIILTPHFYTPIYDDKTITEQKMFVNGIYNLGFLGLKRSNNAFEVINWWKIKLEKECFMDIENGMFVDQLWCNMIPLYFEGVKIEKYPGLNIAYWNLHERQVTFKDGKYYVNGKPLVFFHFSGIDVPKDMEISRWQNRFNLNNRPDLKPIFDLYRKTLHELNYAYYKGFKCYYIKPKPLPKKKSILKRVLTSVSFRIYNFFENLPI